MIPQDTIEQIRQSTDIVQLIGEYIRLKERGKSYLALCPFHTEKTPSFNVSAEKQIYHCFGCGKGGNAITFLMEHERMSFVEAVKLLAQKANIVIREDNVPDRHRERREKVAYANQLAVDFYHRQLKATRYTNVLVDYLKERRKISPEAVEYFKLGLAGSEWDTFLKYALTKSLSADELVDGGLALRSEKKGNYFDRFRQRLMIPIYNMSGKPIAFGARTLKKGEPAKYMNSPETVLYSKSHVLYGLNFAKDAIRDQSTVIVVEGYFDLISLWQVGVRNVVASSGTAFTPSQARLLARFAETVYLFFDADSAGRKAALKTVDSLYDAGMEIMVMEPPEGEDPDSLAVQHGADKINELQDKAVGYIQYRVRDVDMNSAGIIGREKLVKELSAVGSRISDATRRSLFFTEASDRLGIDQHLFQTVELAATTDRDSSPPPSRRYGAVESELLSLLFCNPGSIDRIYKTISANDFDSKELSRLYSAMITQYGSLGRLDAQRLIDSVDDTPFVSVIAEIAAREWEPSIVDSETDKLTEQLLEKKRKRIRTRLMKELSDAQDKQDQKRAEEIVREMESHGLNVDKTKS